MTRLLKTMFKTFSAGTILSLSFSAAAPAIALDDQQKKEMGAFIREYILQNPEILLEAQDALQAKQASQRDQQSTTAIAENKGKIFSSPNDIILGNPKGDVTVVEFFDYNCGYCKRALSDMEDLIGKDKNIRFVLKEFPILGPDSIAAHRVADAVRRVAPQSYGEFHNTLMRQQHASEATAIAVADSLGVDQAAIRKSIADNPNDELVKETYELANAIGITGTPTYIVGDEAVFGAQGIEVLEPKIANVRSCGKATC